MNPLAGLTAPTLVDFQNLTHEAYRRLPEAFRAKTAGLVIHIEDFPNSDVLLRMGAKTPFDILGLFHGVGLAQDSAVTETGRMPNIIWLYRRPILNYWAEHHEALSKLITHVLVHEIGHHFGLSDEDIERIEMASS